MIDCVAAPSYVIGSAFANEDGEGMKEYLTQVFAGKGAFGRVEWYEKIIKLKKEA
jgi:hypothetical protein